MRIAYVCYWDMARDDGVAQKIETQIAQWRQFGHVAELFALATQTPVAGTAPSPGAAPGAGAAPVAGMGPVVGAEAHAAHRILSLPKRQWSRLRRSTRLAEAVTSYRPDVVYLRYDLFSMAIAKLLRRLPAVIEINSDLGAELRGRRVAAFYEQHNLRALSSAATGFVCVTHELAQSLAGLAKPTIVIGNGIDIDRIARSMSALPAQSRPQLVWIGSPDQPWNGLDKLVWLATQMSGCDFTLIGVTPAELPQPPPGNLRAVGHLERARYDAMLREADVGIATLALHRKGMNEASPLKVREYLAYGLPVIAPYDDTDFRGKKPWYFLDIPNTESNVRDHLRTIRAFVETMRGRRVPREEIVDRIGAERKERMRLRFLEEVSDRGTATGVRSAPGTWRSRP
jgi:hypothetical protein